MRVHVMSIVFSPRLLCAWALGVAFLLSSAPVRSEPEYGSLQLLVQAEQILREGRADLVALAREMLHNPNWALDAASKMGLDGNAMVPPAAGWWLQKRLAAMPALRTSTQAT